MDLIIGGMAAAPVIFAIIEAAKALGMDVKYARWANGLLSLAAYAVIQAVELGQIDSQYVTWAIFGLAVFLGTAGFYDVTKEVISEPLEAKRNG